MRALLGENKKGVVLIIASMAGYRGLYSAPLYCATKHAIVGFVRSMKEADRLEGVKVVTIAPGYVEICTLCTIIHKQNELTINRNVRTPLWTDQQKKQYHFSDENSISPEEVAESMIDLIQSGKYGGGTSLEISPGSIRSLGTWNISEPKAVTSENSREFGDINYAPIIQLVNKERNTNLRG